MPFHIHLGFEVGTGRAVEIPLKNTAVTGMTQEAGKTTALEALISRSDRSALVFRTKRGESAFASGKTILPYFRERADWQFVAAILEASLREKMKFERAFIMRASKGAKSLAQVQQNVQDLMPKARGFAADMYYQLNEYLSIVVPEISKTKFEREAPTIFRGLNVMDLTKISFEMQSLVISSTLEHVYSEWRDVITVIPEAWEFMPQKRRSPVTLAAEALVRKGSALKNFVFIDSQDIAGVSKDILRSVPVWLLGVQREANEVKRTLGHIPAGLKKPKLEDVMRLGKGEFFACFGGEVVKTYVQPSWMTAKDAEDHARGKSMVITQNSHHVFRAAYDAEVNAEVGEDNDEREEDPQVTKAEADELRSENAELKSRIRKLESRLEAAMAPTTVLQKPSKADAAALARPGAVEFVPPFGDVEGLYESFKERLIEEAPAIIKLLTKKPEIEIVVARKVFTIDGDTSKGAFAKLIAEGFFDSGATASAAYSEMVKRGVSIAKPTAYAFADSFTTMGFLRKEKDGYRSVEGMKVNLVEA